LTETNSSDEHIIPNGIGGRLKSKKLLCQTCNSNFGSDCDIELVNQFLFLTSHLQVKKHRGDVSPIKGGKTKDGEVYNIVDGSKPVLTKPVYKVTKDGDNVTFNITARDENELRAMLKGIARKYPIVNVEEAMAKAAHKTKYLDTPLEFQLDIGGNLAFRSIAKTAVNFYLYCNGNKGNIVHLIPYLRGDSDSNVVYHFNPDRTPYNEIDSETLHVLYLVGDAKAKLLYCYVNFFSTFSFIVFLSEAYEGNDFKASCFYDLLQNIEVKKSIELALTREEINDIFNKIAWQDNAEMIVKKMNRVMEIASKRHTDQAISDITSKAVEEIFAQKYRHEPVITEQMIVDFSAVVAEMVVRFMDRGKGLK